MAWTAPRTWVTSETVTAALMNTHVRDNLNLFDSVTESSFWASDGSGPAARIPSSAQGNAIEFTFTNTSYLDLDAVTGGSTGDAMSVSVSTGTLALVLWRAQMDNNTAGSRVFLGYKVTGATTTSAADSRALIIESDSADQLLACGTQDLAALTAGTNVFELQAHVSGNTGTISRTELIVIPF